MTEKLGLFGFEMTAVIQTLSNNNSKKATLRQEDNDDDDDDENEN